MMRKPYRLLPLALILLSILLLCGCKGSLSLGERAIVKAIYLTKEDERVQAALVVFTCAPNADTAQVEGQAEIYTGEGGSIEEAIYSAEQKQNKKPFYAQNEMLLIGTKAAQEDVTPYLSYFSREEASRPNLAAFLTPLDLDEFEECGDVMNDVILEGERMIGSADAGQNGVSRIYEFDFSAEKKFSGFLPVYTFSKEEKSTRRVTQLILFSQGAPRAALNGTYLQLTMLLTGKTQKLVIHDKINNALISCETDSLQLSRAVSYQGAPHLTIKLSGNIQKITVDGKPIEQEDTAVLVQAINAYFEGAVAELNRQTFSRGNDVFDYLWWFKNYDAALCNALERSGDIYRMNCVTFESRLKIV